MGKGSPRCFIRKSKSTNSQFHQNSSILLQSDLQKLCMHSRTSSRIQWFRLRFRKTTYVQSLYSLQQCSHTINACSQRSHLLAESGHRLPCGNCPCIYYAIHVEESHQHLEMSFQPYRYVHNGLQLLERCHLSCGHDHRHGQWLHQWKATDQRGHLMN